MISTLFELMWTADENAAPQILHVFSSEPDPGTRGICVKDTICVSHSETALRAWDWKQKSKFVELRPYEGQNHKVCQRIDSVLPLR